MRLSAQGCFFLNNILFDQIFMDRKTNKQDVIIIVFLIITVFYKQSIKNLDMPIQD
jgi:hypothetical protein